MKLRALLILIVIYVLAAFGWLTYSLLNYSNSEYNLKNDVLKAGLNACTLQIIQGAKNGTLGSDSSQSFYLKQLKLDLDTSALSQFLRTAFDGNYEVTYSSLQGKTIIQLQISKARIAALDDELKQQRSIWWFQSLLLLVLVGTGIYGVFYSVNSLYKLNKQQNNFLLSVTHEFKTPIAAIRLLLQTVQNPKIKEQKKAELIDKSIQNTHRLEELAENMLTATQMEYNSYQYNKIPFNISELLLRMVQVHSVKGEIETAIEPDVMLNGDEFILRIAISNLIGNAFKYAEGEVVSVVLFTKKKYAVIQIKDRGIGIPKGEYKRVFNKFYRVQDEETRTTKGTGLGLFIVKRAILRHGGSVEARANEPKGTVFEIKLPL